MKSYVQPVPDHCDRIIWRGHYYHLPLCTKDTINIVTPVAGSEDTTLDAHETHITLKWCKECGEGVTNFCRSKMDDECPMNFSKPPNAKL